MIYFPQLNSGGIGQFPLRWTDSFRSVMNVLTDGSAITLTDPGATSVAWDLSFQELNESERAAIQSLFESVRGSLNSFTVLDPADNLLAFSQDFTQACWAADPLLRMDAGTADPFGGTAATTVVNTAQTAQSITQQINGPGGFRYVLSIYTRSTTEQTLYLTQSCRGAVVRQPVTTSAAWRRAAFSATVASGDGVRFGIEVPSGAEVDLFGVQVEAQPAPGTYKGTANNAGVYENCRFEQDELQMTATGPGAYRCTLRIRSAGRMPW